MITVEAAKAINLDGFGLSVGASASLVVSGPAGAEIFDARGRSPMCHQRIRPSLGREAGGRSPGFICIQSITTPFRQLSDVGGDATGFVASQ